MGKEWYWAGRSSKRGAGAETTETHTQTETPSGCMCAVFQFFDFHPFHFPINQQQTSFKSSSCIPEDKNTVPKGAEAPRNSLESEDGNGTVSSVSKEENFKIPKNIQIKTSGGSTRSSSARPGNLNDLSLEISSSPGTKTPTLVARLMGLDLLPGADSPSSSSSSSYSSYLSTPNPPQGNPHLHPLRPRQHIQTKPRNSTDSDNIAATRSLPETPRISLARRSDVDHYQHRLSLQINEENIGLGDEELELTRVSFSKRKCDENSSRSPGHYARQIVKQVRGSVSRKVGHDITNTLKNRDQQQGSDAFVGQIMVKKLSPKTSVKTVDESSPGKHSNSSNHSPRLRFLDNKHKPTSTTSSPLTPKDQNTHQVLTKLPLPPPSVNIQLPQVSRVLTKSKPQALPEQELQNQKSSVPKCKKATNEKFSPRLKRPPQTSDIVRNKQEESFIIRPPSSTRPNDIKTNKSKKTHHPLSNNLLNNINSSTAPNLLPVKTDPSPPATKIPQKQSQVSDSQESSKRSSQLSSCSSQRHKQEGTSSTHGNRGSIDEDKSNGASTTGGADDHGPEFQYVTGILTRTTALEKGASTTTTTTSTSTSTLSFHQWFSPTHPLDPSIFHHLEHHHHHPTSISSVSSTNNYQGFIFTMKNQLGHRWNRRLLFDLVDEVLLEILRPNGKEKKLWPLHDYCYSGSLEGLIERVWKRIRRFPRSKCEALEDIDGVIEAEDMDKLKMEGTEAMEEEGGGLAAEIEGNIWDTLVHETVLALL